MTPAPIPAEDFGALAGTRPAARGTRTLRAAIHARRMLLLKSLLVRTDRQRRLLDPAVRRDFERAWALLTAAERTGPAAVREVLDYPTTGAWLAAALAAPQGAAFERHLAHLAGVAVAAAVRAGHPPAGTLAVPTGLLALPGLGVLRCPSGRVRLAGGPGGARIADDGGHTEAVLPHPASPTGPGASRTADGSGWSALRTLPGGTVRLDDLDPYRTPLPGTGPGPLRAADRCDCPWGTWARRWRRARELLTAVDGCRAAETGAVLRAVVPLAAPDTGAAPMGATLRSAPGAALLQLPGTARELAESLVHETHHTKLAALDELVPLCRPGKGASHRVGWRPDPRPVPAVLQGAYAHLALTDLWWRVRTGAGAAPAWRRRAGERFEGLREEVGQALSLLLESDELTPAGREFVQGMERHHAGLGVTAQNVL
ncbi:aKG-HExxH-type peptide beta-hydroxylase [Streptomyces cellostaticus]|uniref:aKG-HExxH-type peptide beta-hydroxylase n=1 Tax=Streptomyces cellostaticus TaxID=67285 RepID=UPI002027115C|nr:HEXXH motif-containing putative peptide modification protein [Streptomyces cellostaticus]